MASHVRHTDSESENFLPTMDVAGRAGFMILTDGTNTQPTLDTAGRAGFVKVTDGTNTLAVSASGAVLGSQGTKTSDLTNAWPIRMTDGANYQPTLDVAGRAGYIKVTDGTNTQPTLDTAGRAGFVKVTDGTNTQPTLDTAGRAGFFKITNGTYNADINSSGCLMTCPGTTSRPLTFSATEAKANRLFMTTGDFTMPLRNVSYPGLLFKNPSGSGVEMYIKNITLANLTAAGHVFCRIYSNPTITNAGSNNFVNTTCANIGLASSSVVTTDTSITYSNIGIHLVSNVSFSEQITLEFDFGIILQPNTTLLFVFESSANNQTVTSNITFSQVSL